ncbi:MAG TPA: CoA-binding protein [bacterium]|nr:CoA-binding protein [bacterium]
MGRDISADENAIRQHLDSARTIAIFGASTKPDRAANGIQRYLMGRGYEVTPINPGHDAVLGIPCLPNLAALPEPVDIVNVFRRSEDIPAFVDQLLAVDWKPQLVFIQLGIRNDPAAKRLVDAGIDVVQDRCIYIEHWRLIGSKTPLPNQS